MRKHVWSIKPSDRNRDTFSDKPRSSVNAFQIKQEHFLNFKNTNQIGNTIKFTKIKFTFGLKDNYSSTFFLLITKLFTVCNSEK